MRARQMLRAAVKTFVAAIILLECFNGAVIAPAEGRLAFASEYIVINDSAKKPNIDFPVMDFSSILCVNKFFNHIPPEAPFWVFLSSAENNFLVKRFFQIHYIIGEIRAPYEVTGYFFYDCWSFSVVNDFSFRQKFLYLRIAQ